MLTTTQDMRDEIKTALEFDTLDSIRDNIGEWIDGYLPIYYTDIVKEWQEMPSEYDNRGAEELGTGGKIDIYNLMTLDLYVYYLDLFNEVLDDIEEEGEEEGEED